ncbi:Crp/Fnr family transcriptional regulator [Sinomicrobium pectinilyticum]|uniref:Crp/Fnr family transcriptional regulator n=1 Tax=Sinomicrobium pectinilyticum TaxID=1084421 RepID=A0A3N0E9E5_SINP1|nr:Crp/Fnr family transcriptional regulator [Sinomicrobium pectinilyticum]RNL84473.1 Crp/Fnr family transcriptional regulator [Sinomicrobium pectinilyticum]
MQETLKRHITEIIPLTEDEFAFVAAHFSVQNFKKREYLIRQGKNVPYTYFVVSGLLKLIYNDESGKEHILSFAMEDWWETDFLAFYSGTKATMSLQCLEDTCVLCISLEDYEKLCSGLPKMEHFFLKKATSGHIASQQRIFSLLSSNARDRYNQLLKRYPSLFQRVPKTLIASYLGVSRETLSRLSS